MGREIDEKDDNTLLLRVRETGMSLKGDSQRRV
jgi:hypothetical protein